MQWDYNYLFSINIKLPTNALGIPLRIKYYSFLLYPVWWCVLVGYVAPMLRLVVRQVGSLCLVKGLGGQRMVEFL